PNEMWALKVAEGAEILRVDEADKQTLFMPQKMCTVERERVRLHRNYYYSTALQEYNGERMRVAYDIHDADFVWIYDDVGRFVAKAEWN
ncbi:Mu transposase C-terminal domain-containing protein, partial [Guyparkeria sp. 1SP6A2]|nr:Mu transposase C-terminal domain-containing protein [Guyparkeria sp. 1SP6A2]